MAVDRLNAHGLSQAPAARQVFRADLRQPQIIEPASPSHGMKQLQYRPIIEGKG